MRTRRSPPHRARTATAARAHTGRRRRTRSPPRRSLLNTRPKTEPPPTNPLTILPFGSVKKKTARFLQFFIRRPRSVTYPRIRLARPLLLLFVFGKVIFRYTSLSP